MVPARPKLRLAVKGKKGKEEGQLRLAFFFESENLATAGVAALARSDRFVDAFPLQLRSS